MKTKKNSKKQTTGSTTSEKRPAKRKTIVSLEQYEADRKAHKDGGDKKAAPETKAAKAAKEKRTGGLDAAVQVLAEAGKPMNCGDMVKQMLDRGLWKTNGKTPSATIYAAILRECATKGEASRFRKTDRGHFELTAAGIASLTAAAKEAK